MIALAAMRMLAACMAGGPKVSHDITYSAQEARSEARHGHLFVDGREDLYIKTLRQPVSGRGGTSDSHNTPHQKQANNSADRAVAYCHGRRLSKWLSVRAELFLAKGSGVVTAVRCRPYLKPYSANRRCRLSAVNPIYTVKRGKSNSRPHYQDSVHFGYNRGTQTGTHPLRPACHDQRPLATEKLGEE